MTKIHKHKFIFGHEHKNKKFVDRLTYVAAVVEPFFLYPQALQIFRHGDASGISIPSWIAIDFFTATWIWYALVHKQRMIFIYQALFFIANSLILVGAIMYGGKWF